jgi:hypothetical protein
MPLSVRSNSRTANASAVRTSHISNAMPQWAQTTGQWLSVRSVFSAPRALGSGLLAGLAARRRRLLRARRRGTFAATNVPAADVAARRIAPTAKRRGGRPRTVGRIQRQTFAQLHRQGVKTASQLDKLRRFQRLEYGAVHSGQVKLVFGFHVPSESQMLSLCKPPRQSLENHRRVNRLHLPRRDVNGYSSYRNHYWCCTCFFRNK